METLEKLADKILAGEVTSEEAGDLIKKEKILFFKENSKQKLPKNLLFVSGENSFTLIDKNTNEDIACLSFCEGMNRTDSSYSCLYNVNSFEENNGNFRYLFDRYEKLAKQKRYSHILLEVEETNQRAISIYEHLGFYFSGNVEDGKGMIFMRKDL